MFDQMPFYQLFRSLVICQKEDQTRGLSENSKRKPFRFFSRHKHKNKHKHKHKMTFLRQFIYLFEGWAELMN